MRFELLFLRYSAKVERFQKSKRIFTLISDKRFRGYAQELVQGRLPTETEKWQENEDESRNIVNDGSRSFLLHSVG